MAKSFGTKIEDFVDIKEVHTTYAPNDLVHICKRKNNTKREYLFVNRFQGKHIPAKPFDIASLLVELCEQIVLKFDKEERKGEKVVIVGFAETATAIGEGVSYLLSLSNSLPFEIVEYLQTTREKCDCKKLFNFEEEHSHAVNQCLYCKDELKDFDRVLFLEDEITTGNTILNFISEFSKINPNCKYSVASVLNWQTQENIDKFEKKGIERIYLISGEIKDNVPTLDVKENGVLDYFTEQNSNEYRFVVHTSDVEKNKVSEATTKIDVKEFQESYQLIDARKGLNKEEIYRETKDRIKEVISKGLSDVMSLIDKNDRIMVVGTEEFMFYPLLFSFIIQLGVAMDLCGSVKFRATTRSPITPAKIKGYEIQDGITIPSAYDAKRQTYLYNLSSEPYNKMIVITEEGASNEFLNAMEKYCEDACVDLSVICL